MVLLSALSCVQAVAAAVILLDTRLAVVSLQARSGVAWVRVRVIDESLLTWVLHYWGWLSTGLPGGIFIRVLVVLLGVIEGAYVWRLDLIISFRLLDWAEGAIRSIAYLGVLDVGVRKVVLVVGFIDDGVILSCNFTGDSVLEDCNMTLALLG